MAGSKEGGVHIYIIAVERAVITAVIAQANGYPVYLLIPTYDVLSGRRSQSRDSETPSPLNLRSDSS